MKKEETGIIIPFLGGIVFPLEKIIQQIKGFILLVGCFSFFSAVVSALLGRGFACGLGLDDKMFFCANNIWNLTISIFLLVILTALFIHRWWLLSFANQSFADVIKKCIELKDLKIVGFILLFLVLSLFIGGCVYALYVRKATANLNFELAWFVFVSFFIIATFFLLINAVIFARFLDGKKWLVLNKTFWPIFDNIYKLMGWLLVYLLFFVYFSRQAGNAFFVLQQIFPVWLASFVGDFSLYCIYYFMVVCFVSILKYQEMYIFANEDD